VLIGELSRLTGVSPRSIRHYEVCGLLTVRRYANGYRDYEPRSVPRILWISDLVACGFSLREVRALFKHAPLGDGTFEDLDIFLRAKLVAVDKEIAGLMGRRARLQARLACGEPGQLRAA
jgi:DNA-binding transcriptional MerR regulator